MALWARTLLLTAPLDQVEPFVEAHLDHLRELSGRGRLRAAGSLGDGDGYLEIFEAVDRLEAEQIARSSPLVEEGLGTWMLREWKELDL